MYLPLKPSTSRIWLTVSSGYTVFQRLGLMVKCPARAFLILALAVSVADWMERQVSISVAMTSRNASSVRVLPFLRMEYRQARLHRFMSEPPHFLRVKPACSLVYLLT